LVAMFQTISLHTVKSTQIFEGEQQIRPFLESRIKKRHKGDIEIAVH